jgi:hypothetical protein
VSAGPTRTRSYRVRPGRARLSPRRRASSVPAPPMPPSRHEEPAGRHTRPPALAPHHVRAVLVAAKPIPSPTTAHPWDQATRTPRSPTMPDRKERHRSATRPALPRCRRRPHHRKAQRRRPHHRRPHHQRPHHQRPHHQRPHHRRPRRQGPRRQGPRRQGPRRQGPRRQGQHHRRPRRQGWRRQGWQRRHPPRTHRCPCHQKAHLAPPRLRPPRLPHVASSRLTWIRLATKVPREHHPLLLTRRGQPVRRTRRARPRRTGRQGRARRRPTRQPPR